MSAEASARAEGEGAFSRSVRRVRCLFIGTLTPTLSRESAGEGENRPSLYGEPLATGISS